MNNQTAETLFRVVMMVSPFVLLHLFPVFTYVLFCYAKEWEPSFVLKRPRAIYYLPVALVGYAITSGILEQSLYRPEFYGTVNSYGYESGQGLAILMGLATFPLSLGWAHEFASRRVSSDTTCSHLAMETAQKVAHRVPREVAVLKAVAIICLFFGFADVLPMFLFRSTAEGAAAAAQGLSLRQSLTAETDATQFLLFTGLAQLVSFGVHGGVFGLLQRRDPRVKSLLVFWLGAVATVYLVRLLVGGVPFAVRPFFQIFYFDTLTSPIIAWALWRVFRSPECQTYFKT